MSTATAPLAAGFTLTGTTFARDTAPIFFEISGPSFGLAVGEQYSLAALSRIRQTTSPDGKIEVYIDNLLLKRFDTSGEAASVIASINQAVGTISRSIQQQATNAGPAPTPTPTPSPATRPANTNVTNTTNTTSTAATTVVTTPTSVTVITESSTTTTTGGTARTVTAPAPVAPVAVTAEPPPPPIKLEPITVDVPQFDSDGNQIGTSQVVIESPPTTTDPSILDELGPLEVPQAISDEELAELSAQAAADASAAIAAAEEELRVAGAEQDQFVFQGRKDWRVRLSLSDAPEVNYLYRAPNPGILNPLNATNGVLFPYTPTISVNYTASYNPTELVHSNYKVFQYSSSSIDSITLSCDFTAQSTYEADYLLAVIHFFRSATKMFYGQDENPRRGTPPPLCYIYGMGSYQFAGQPLAISQFSYNLPNNVDYIKTSSTSTIASTSTQLPRLAGTGAAKGGVLPPANFAPLQEPDTISWVPSKIQLQITCVPMLSRNAVSNKFSLEQYATGALLNGIGKPGGGFW